MRAPARRAACCRSTRSPSRSGTATTPCEGGPVPGVIWVWNEPELWRVLRSYEGPVGLHIAKLARKVTRTAKRYANVSPDGDIEAGRPPGYMRSKIRWDMGRDLIGVYADISSPA